MAVAAILTAVSLTGSALTGIDKGRAGREVGPSLLRLRRAWRGCWVDLPEPTAATAWEGLSGDRPGAPRGIERNEKLAVAPLVVA